MLQKNVVEDMLESELFAQWIIKSTGSIIIKTDRVNNIKSFFGESEISSPRDREDNLSLFFD